jgi:hypothetical protein
VRCVPKLRPMITKMRKANPRGRPRLGDCRIETVIPQAVMDALKASERETGMYHTRVAANVLCEWQKANASGGSSPQT